jgi:broad specificity phosphatase PhoE
MEMAFGSWEGMPAGSLTDDDLAVRIYEHFEDLPRGGTGETFMQVVKRMRAFLAGLVVDPGERTVVVSHGAAIRAVIAGIHDRGNDINRTLGVPTNSSVTHVALGPEGPILVDYALSPHLEIM